MGKIITFGTLKGGTGKSTSAFSTAGILAERNYKVLVVDVDPQANVTSDLGVDEPSISRIGIKEILEDGSIPPEKVVIKAPVKELPNLDVIISSMDLTSTEIKIITYVGREFLLKKYFRKNKEFFDQYDYIIFDTNPSMSIVNQNSLVVSDAIVIVTDIGINGLKGFELFVALWENILDILELENNIKGLLVNKYDKESSFSQEFIEYCNEEEETQKLLFKSLIPLDSILPECELFKKPINLVDKNSEVYKQFNNFVDELINRM